MNCPTCGKPDFNPPWLRARQAGFDPGKHCVLFANKFGLVVPCKPLAEIGRQDCSGGECKVAERHTEIVSDKYGRTKEVFRP